MKKNLWIATALISTISLTSCEKKPSVDFTKDIYSLHYNETLPLGITTENVEKSEFQYSSKDHNVVTVSNSGLVTGMHVGTTTVMVTNGDVSDQCIVEVIPYVTLFEAPLLNISELTMNELKTVENRTLRSEDGNTLTYSPLEREDDIESLQYTFMPDGSVILAVTVKDEISDDTVNLFLQERYFEEGNDRYFDHNTSAHVVYSSGTIFYTYEMIFYIHE